MRFILSGFLVVMLALMGDITGSARGMGLSARAGQPVPPLLALRMTDVMHGWALESGNVLKTSDGGRTWVVLTPAGATAWRADFMNAQYAWFSMLDGEPMINGDASKITIFATTTGGATWKKSIIREVAPDGGSLTFVSSKVGWLEVSPDGAGAGSEDIDIFRTDDGGASWNKISSSNQDQALPFGGIKSGLSFINPLAGWATGEDASNAPWLYMTHDGGRTWYQKSIAGLGRSASAGYQTAPPVVLGANGFLPITVTDTSTHTILARSTDSGASWTVSGQQAAPFQSSNVYVLNAQMAWATDQNTGDVYRTNNGGKSWQKISSNTGIYGQLSFINNTTGFGLGRGDQAVLKRTNDGGRSWQSIAYRVNE